MKNPPLMVLLILKNLLFPRSHAQTGSEHQRLLLNNNDPELGQSQSRELSINSGTTANSKSNLKLGDPKTPSTSRTPPLEKCRVNPRLISDLTIGLSDGLTVPFALTAGLSALGTTELVVYAGFAELVAGAISMGLGGYLGAKSEAEGYNAVLEETNSCVVKDGIMAGETVRNAFEKYGFEEEVLERMVSKLEKDQEKYVEFLMRFRFGMVEGDFVASRAYCSGLTIAGGYFLGGMVPLVPYLFFERVRDALYCSILVMAITLFVFGWVKTNLVGACSRWVCFRNAVQMLVLGGAAAGAAMGCVKAIGGG